MARAAAIRNWSLSPAEPDRHQALEGVLEVELLPKTELKYYFSDSRILHGHVLVLTKITHSGQIVMVVQTMARSLVTAGRRVCGEAVRLATGQRLPADERNTVGCQAVCLVWRRCCR